MKVKCNHSDQRKCNVYCSISHSPTPILKKVLMGRVNLNLGKQSLVHKIIERAEQCIQSSMPGPSTSLQDHGVNDSPASPVLETFDLEIIAQNLFKNCRRAASPPTINVISNIQIRPAVSSEVLQPLSTLPHINSPQVESIFAGASSLQNVPFQSSSTPETASSSSCSPVHSVDFQRAVDELCDLNQQEVEIVDIDSFFSQYPCQSGNMSPIIPSSRNDSPRPATSRPSLPSNNELYSVRSRIHHYLDQTFLSQQVGAYHYYFNISSLPKLEEEPGERIQVDPTQSTTAVDCDPDGSQRNGKHVCNAIDDVLHENQMPVDPPHSTPTVECDPGDSCAELNDDRNNELVEAAIRIENLLQIESELDGFTQELVNAPWTQMERMAVDSPQSSPDVDCETCEDDGNLSGWLDDMVLETITRMESDIQNERELDGLTQEFIDAPWTQIIAQGLESLEN